MTDLESHPNSSFCLFSSKGNVFACAATSVRSVAVCPDITPLPKSNSALLGLVYQQKEFLPVFDLGGRTKLLESKSKTPHQLLTLSVDDGDFGLLVDQVLGLDMLETSYATSSSPLHEWSGIVVGSATYRDQFVSVIEPATLASLLKERLEQGWKQPDALAEIALREPTDAEALAN